MSAYRMIRFFLSVLVLGTDPPFKEDPASRAAFAAVAYSVGRDKAKDQLLDALRQWQPPANFPKTNRRFRNAMEKSVLAGDTDVTRELLKKGVWDVNASLNKENCSALHLTAFVGNLTLVKLLEECKANLEATTEDGSTALLVAACYGHLATVNFLKVSGADVNATSSRKANALHCAAWSGRNDVVKWLLGQEDFSHGVDAKNIDGTTALHGAARNGHLATVKR